MAATPTPAAEVNGPADTLGSVDDTLLDCFLVMARLHGRPLSRDVALSGLPRSEPVMTPEIFLRAAEQHDYSARVLRRSLRKMTSLVLPAVLLLSNGTACVLKALPGKRRAVVMLAESGFAEKELALRDLAGLYTGYAIFMQPRPRVDQRMGAEAPAAGGRLWFWKVMWRFRGYFLEAGLAAFTVNVLALATALFIMNVYDRVLPNNAIETLIVLTVGVGIAVGFEFLAKTLRGYFLDVAGRKADVLLAGTLFHQAMGLTMEARPPSAGSFASQLREFESLREFFNSATLATLTDLPFIFFFVWVISLISGPLYLVPLLAVPAVLIVALIAQVPLSIVMKRYMRESNLKHGLLVESVEGVETLKTLGAEGAVQGKWENYTALTGISSTHSRLISSFVVNFAQLCSQGVAIGVVFWGVHLISVGEISMGALIATVILCNRGIAPLSQVAGIMARYQHARAAYANLNELMSRPLERSRHNQFIHRPDFAGGFELRSLSFSYPDATVPALSGLSLKIQPGERVAILGRVGSGKSTLLKLLLKLYAPTGGSILLDDIDLNQYDPAELRRGAGYVSQDVRLFYGTLRENLTLGLDYASDEELLEAARTAGLDDLIARHASGLDLTILEGGIGLSGGQRAAVGLARALVRKPRILLLDEPTASMDHTMEQGFIARMRPWLEKRTLLLVTHKPTLLALVDRVIVLEDGKVLADGPRDQMIEALVAQGQGQAQGQGDGNVRQGP